MSKIRLRSFGEITFAILYFHRQAQTFKGRVAEGCVLSRGWRGGGHSKRRRGYRRIPCRFLNRKSIEILNIRRRG